MEHDHSANTLNLLEDLAREAKKKGASAFAFSHGGGDSVSVSVRNGQIEKIEGDGLPAVGMKIFLGKRTGTASCKSLRPADLKRTLAEAFENARYVSQDKHQALADPDQVITSFPDLELNDPVTPDIHLLIEAARATEEIALSHTGITNSSGASAGWSRTLHTFMCSNGFAGQSIESGHSLRVSVIGGNGDFMETDSAGHAARWREDLDSPEQIGNLAAERTLKKLDSVKIATTQAPVIFDRRCSTRLVNAFLQAIKASSLYNKHTYLDRNAIGKQFFGDTVQIIEDPFRLRGLNSGGYDSYGIARKAGALVENGILKTFLVDLPHSRKLKMACTGHSGGVSNVFMAAGTESPQDMIAGLERGLLVTHLVGGGAHLISGQYSSGAEGFWIENGAIAFPVSEITLAGNLADMCRTLVPANDLDRTRSHIAVPSLRIDGMKIGGK